ncbi:regulator of protease activity HflC (stomatin/prohibitin superfamily) [Inhella inkyongensis]|uniref:Regulator of protease activity HflC (Stomatin/prohibitin superfamily) n=1 Tax=Inhella inkyongensis TaxID=392593 RepID=A0A840SAS9_9BURK|nr:SPFH domain-containing protein [Inhella inkyongensis]MBB5205480.1 regulator of protease activity HflC (stomatin/prohibitin superfamily) [Inhella inkyongensis]
MSKTTQSPTTERPATSANGYAAIVCGLGLLLAGGFLFSRGVFPLLPLALVLAGGIALAGLYMLSPNQAAALTLFGAYTGTDRGEGLRWANPLTIKRKISLRDRNLNAPTLKVNDARGNPIEISAVVVWRVADSAKALFQVDDYEAYVRVQAEAAIRHLAASYAYDEGENPEDAAITLRGGQNVVALALRKELQERFEDAGVAVIDAKISHLAYAPEIAQVMLRRQQAEAIISARSKIVHGAVTMVEAALKGLSEREIVHLDDERKAAMVSNLLVVLCSDRETQPIVNTGTLYS